MNSDGLCRRLRSGRAGCVLCDNGMIMNAETATAFALENDDEKARNLNGQRIGRKGQQTRQRLLDAAVEVLKNTGLRDVSVAELARRAGTSPATFYVYFAGVPELVLEALKIASQSDEALLRYASADWSDDPDGSARRFVDRYFDLWQRHRTLYVVRNLTAEEGDKRFIAARQRSARPVIEALAENVARAKARKAIETEVSDLALAAAIVTMVERISAVAPGLSDDSDVGAQEIRSAAVFAAKRILGY